MKWKRHSPEQIIAKLRETEAGAGMQQKLDRAARCELTRSLADSAHQNCRRGDGFLHPAGYVVRHRGPPVGDPVHPNADVADRLPRPPGRNRTPAR